MDMDRSMHIHEKFVDMVIEMDVTFRIHGKPAHLNARRRRVKPTTMARMLPHLWLSSSILPPKKTGLTVFGQRPSSNILTNAVRSVKRPGPDSRQK